jgi:glycosyltransferase involved in cell wall biosynthesis
MQNFSPYNDSMKIGFDAKRALCNQTGLGNYSRYLVLILSKLYPACKLLLFLPKERENDKLNLALAQKNVTTAFPSGLYRRFASLWRMFGMSADIKKANLNLFHGLTNELPIGIKSAGVASVVTIHDLIFLRFPHFYPFFDRLIYRFKVGYACRKADKIIAISECTKRDINAFYHVPLEKIEVIYQGCDTVFLQKLSAQEKSKVLDKYRLQSGFILNVGTIEARKNLLLIVKALRELPQSVHLVAIGKSTPYRKKVEEYVQANGLTDRVHLLQNVPFEELPAFYQSASVFVYPSYFEGFGIPVIEAISSGVPVVAATGSCLEEAGGDGALYINPDDEKSLSKAVLSIFNNEKLRTELIHNGEKHIEQFSEIKIAKKIMHLYQSLCQPSRL